MKAQKIQIRVFKSVVVALLGFYAFSAQGQQTGLHNRFSNLIVQQHMLVFPTRPSSIPIPADRKSALPPPQCALPPKWSAESLPFFCKIEHNWAKTNHIPVKFRLGSVEYVDRLEGKIR